MELQALLDAGNYGSSSHVVRVVHDGCLRVATGKKTLAASLEDAFHAGYRAKEEDDRQFLAKCPGPEIETASRQALLRSGDADYERRAGLPWTWDDDLGGWMVEDDDCTLRPGEDGAVIVMEAAGEWSGCVVMPNGDIARFPTGTFR